MAAPKPKLTLNQRLAKWTAWAKYASHYVAVLKARVAARKTKTATPTVMFDSITLDAIPKDAKAAAGYVGGRWPTFPRIVSGWPKARHVSIAVTAKQDADMLDVEPGDAVPAQAVDWYHRQKARGVKRPGFYTSASQLQALVDLLAHAGIARKSVRIWSAHYTMRSHICGPGCGFGIRIVADATQWTDKSQGKNLDESKCSATFWQ